MIDALVRFALTQRALVLALSVGLLLGGAWAFRGLSIDAFPDISTPQVQIIVKGAGLSPAEVEQGITTPLEVAMRGIPRQSMLRSMTKYALCVVTLDFEEGTDIYWARQQVSERLSQTWGQLPPGVEGGLAPVTSPLSEAFMFTLEGAGRSPRELRGVLDWVVRPRLLAVDGVAEVNALGGEVRVFEVVPDPQRLAALDLDPEDIGTALRENNRNTGGDRIDRQGEVLLVRTVGRLRDADDIAQVSVATRDGVPIHVSDLAEVRLGAMTRHGAVSKDGRGEHVQGLVLTRLGANGRQTVAAVKERLKEIAAALPAGVRVVPFYDRTELVRLAVAMVRDALLIAIALVLFVLVAFMGNLRSALAVAAVLPLSVAATFLTMRARSMGANLMSLGGLAIAIGMLVDPAVVVVENVQTRLARQARGVDRLHAVYRAVIDVAEPVVSGTSIIVLVFLPLLSLSGLEGKLFAPLAETIALALVAAVLVALIAIPVLSSFLVRAGSSDENALIRAFGRVHGPVVRWALRRRAAAVSAAVALTALAAWMLTRIGAEFMPRLDEGTVVVQTSKLPSISLERSLQIDGEIQRAMLEVPDVQHVVSRMGSDELRLDPMGLHETDHYLVTRPRSQWQCASSQELENALRAELEPFAGVEFGFTQPIEMRTSEMITGVRAALAIKVFGSDLALLETTSARIEELVARTPGAVDVMRSPLSGQATLEIRARPAAMARFGLRTEDLNRLVESAVAGRIVTEVTEPDRRTGVLLRYPAATRDTPEALAALLVETPTGARVPLGSLSEIVETDGPVRIDHEGSLRHVAIQANVEGRDLVGLVDELRERIARDVTLPAGSFVQFGGQFENQQRASRRLALVVPVAIALIFLILFSTFRSLRQTGLILLNIPFASIGGVAALAWSGLYLSVPASVGFIALFGTAILNGIVLVSTFNQLRASGLPLDAAVEQGARRRLRPVLMTAATTALGLVPLLVATGPGSEIQRPLAVVVVGGLVSSTLLTLVLLPSLYAWIEGHAERSRRTA